jgi:hypothetical protein
VQQSQALGQRLHQGAFMRIGLLGGKGLGQAMDL